MAIVKVKDSNFEKEVIKSGTPVLVDFFAEWCGPCKMAEPILEELSESYKGKVKFVKVNVDEDKKAPGRYGVMSIPTTIMVKNGNEVGRQVGFAGKNGFEDLVKKAI